MQAYRKCRLLFAESFIEEMHSLKIPKNEQFPILRKLLEKYKDSLNLTISFDTNSACQESFNFLESHGLEVERVIEENFERNLKSKKDQYGDDYRADWDVLIYGTSNYPEKLHEWLEPELFIWISGPGKELLEQRIFAIVGSRSATAYGLKVAGDLAELLSAYEVGIMSGFAKGIDATAQRAALSVGGKVLGVQAGGLLNPYPRTSLDLFEKCSEKGLILAIFPPQEQIKRWHFPRRNQLIAALADEVFVLEGKRYSGSLITAHAALDMGKEIWALPGPIYKSQSLACNALIADGARPLYDFSELHYYLKQQGLLSNPGYRVFDAEIKVAQIEHRGDLIAVLNAIGEGKKELVELAAYLTIDRIDLRKLLAYALSEGLVFSDFGLFSLTAKGLSVIY